MDPLSRLQPTRNVTSRKKACTQCSDAKVRCDQKKNCCTRCELRGFPCHYPTTVARNTAQHTSTDSESTTDISTLDATTFRIREFPAITGAVAHHSQPGSPSSNASFLGPPVAPADIQLSQESHASNSTNFSTPTTYADSPSNFQGKQNWANIPLDFTSIDLTCTVDASRIRTRWMGPFIPSINERLKNSPPNIIHFMSRVFKTYPPMMVRDGVCPPFIHPLQLGVPQIPIPLANCLSLVRMWQGQVRGSEVMLRQTLRAEMKRLYEERESYDQMNLLAAFQAYLIYAMVLFFSALPDESLIDRQDTINLQEFASDISSTGLVCPAELAHARPDWESWIVASAKRRTLYTMYMFDNIFCSVNGLPSFLGEELESLPAPASKLLWEASRRDVWEKEYNRYLSTWEEGGLRIGELWPVPEERATEQRRRVDRWVESVDEFGMMLFAVTLITHGG